MAEEIDCLTINEKSFNLEKEKFVYLSLVKFGKTSLLWIGNCTGVDHIDCEMKQNLTSLSLALNNIGTNIFDFNCSNEFNNDHKQIYEQNLAKRLSKRFNENKPFYVSFNYKLEALHDDNLLLKIEEMVNLFLNEFFQLK